MMKLLIKTLRSFGIIAAAGLMAALAIDAIVMVFAGCWKILSSMIGSPSPVASGLGLMFSGAVLLSVVVLALNVFGKTTRQGK